MKKELKKEIVICRLEYVLDEYLKEYSVIKERLNYLKFRKEECEVNNEYGVAYEMFTRELLKIIIKEETYSLIIKDLRKILCHEAETLQ